MRDSMFISATLPQNEFWRKGREDLSQGFDLVKDLFSDFLHVLSKILLRNLNLLLISLL
jgi:hypothetical protein